jgi:hypothetical protein
MNDEMNDAMNDDDPSTEGFRTDGVREGAAIYSFSACSLQRCPCN